MLCKKKALAENWIYKLEPTLVIRCSSLGEKRVREGCTLGWSRCCGASYVLSEGGGEWPHIMPVICITSLPLPWSPAYSPIVSELLHIITTNYPQQLNNLLLMHLGEYSGWSVEGGPLSWAVPARPFQFVSFLCVETNQNRLRHIPVHWWAQLAVNSIY